MAVFHHIPCGACYYCRKKTFAQCPVYKRVGCSAGFEPSGGGFAGYVRVMDWIVKRGLVKIPDGIPFAQAMFVEPLNTCLKGMRIFNLAADETVLVDSSLANWSRADLPGQSAQVLMSSHRTCFLNGAP